MPCRGLHSASSARKLPTVTSSRLPRRWTNCWRTPPKIRHLPKAFAGNEGASGSRALCISLNEFPGTKTYVQPAAVPAGRNETPRYTVCRDLRCKFVRERRPKLRPATDLLPPDPDEPVASHPAEPGRTRQTAFQPPALL